MNSDKKILVIGIGSEYRSDDRIGIEIARSLKSKNLQNVEIAVESGDGAALMERWKKTETVIIIDAVSSGAKPGTVHRIDANEQQIPSAFFHSSTHAFGIAEAVVTGLVVSYLQRVDPFLLFIPRSKKNGGAKE